MACFGTEAQFFCTKRGLTCVQKLTPKKGESRDFWRKSGHVANLIALNLSVKHRMVISHQIHMQTCDVNERVKWHSAHSLRWALYFLDHGQQVRTLGKIHPGLMKSFSVCSHKDVTHLRPLSRALETRTATGGKFLNTAGSSGCLSCFAARGSLFRRGKGNPKQTP